jgi:hypothetical protein
MFSISDHNHKTLFPLFYFAFDRFNTNLRRYRQVSWSNILSDKNQNSLISQFIHVRFLNRQMLTYGRRIPLPELDKRIDVSCIYFLYFLVLYFMGAAWISSDACDTRVNISHLVTSLPTSRQQHIFALLVTSYQQVWNNLLTTCNNLVEIIRVVARLFWQVRYMLDITRLLQPCVDNLVISWL